MKYRPFWIVDPEEREDRRRRLRYRSRVYLWGYDPGEDLNPGEQQKDPSDIPTGPLYPFDRRSVGVIGGDD